MRGIVLVHGAHVSSGCWDEVAAALRDLGHRVAVVDLHRGSLAADTAAAQAAVDELAGPVVACGWSYGGMVVTGLVLPPGSHLVYLCALMPDEGQTSSELVASHHTPFADVVELNDAGELVVDEDEAGALLWGDLPPDEAAAARSVLRNQAIAPFVETPARIGWREVGSTYVVARHDRVVHPDLQRIMAGAATGTIEWDTSHSPMLSRPDLVVGLLDRLAREAG